MGRGKGGASYPDPDPRIGQAALENARTGQQYLDFMRQQSDVANRWAAQDRAREQTVFQPLQNEYIAKARQGPDYAGVESDVQRATAGVRSAFAGAQGQQERRMAAMGVNPASGRFQDNMRRSEMAEALGVAGAQTATRTAGRQRAEAESEARLTNAINMGSGLAVNPATSLGLANSAASSGFSGAITGNNSAMQGYGQMQRTRIAKANAQSQANSDLWGGVGSMAGLGTAIALSSEDYKEGKKPARGSLAKLREMPVKEWQYKPGIEDGGAARHVGPYAEDFHDATGKGNGRSIPLQDAVGLTMGAVQEVADKVDALSKKVGKAPKRGSFSGAIA